MKKYCCSAVIATCARTLSFVVGIVWAACLAAGDAPETQTTPNLLDEALAKAVLTEQEQLLAPGRWRGGGAHPMPLFNQVWDDWRKLDPVCQKTGRELVDASGRFEPLLQVALQSLDTEHQQKSTPTDKPLAVPANLPSLADAIRQLYTQMHWDLSAEDQQKLAVQSAQVPQPVAQAAAVLLASVSDAMNCRQNILGHWVEDKGLAGTMKDLNAWATTYAYNGNIQAIIDHLDETAPQLPPGTLDKTPHPIKNYVALAQGALAPALVMDVAHQILAGKTFAEDFKFQWQTPLGLIELSGVANDTHDPAKCLLIIDTGGDDTYATTADDAGKNPPISFIIDVAGNDTYRAAPGTGIAYGLAGYSYLLDMAGDDTYEAESTSFGAAAGGVGMLVDLAGNDHYNVTLFGEGAATCGVGILNDDHGNDHYECYELSQGLGKTLGFGALVDRTGNDHYEANDTNIIFPSAQWDKHNASLSQGCAYGRRDHPGEGHSFAGGIGVLADGAGDDTYTAGLFAQASAYWFGFGMLYEGGGNDSYSGMSYVQGAAVHYSAAVLVDVHGNDSYNAARMGQNIGHAKDFSCAVLHDMAGDDHYAAEDLCLGEAWFNAVGVLWDDGGQDTVTSNAARVIGFGMNGEEGPCLGLFLHGTGTCKIDAPQATHVTEGFWNKPGEGGARSIGWQRGTNSP